MARTAAFGTCLMRYSSSPPDARPAPTDRRGARRSGLHGRWRRDRARWRDVTGANSRARTRTKSDAAGAKLSQKNHLQERQLLRTRGIAALAREFAPVTGVIGERKDLLRLLLDDDHRQAL